jgi:hypothetical protein
MAHRVASFAAAIAYIIRARQAASVQREKDATSANSVQEQWVL